MNTLHTHVFNEKIMPKSLIICALAGFLLSAAPAQGQKVERRTIHSRVFVQDEAEVTLRWMDMARPVDVANAAPTPVNLAEVSGFPKLDSASQSLVQMKQLGRFLLVGVRDEEDGTFQSGWILIDTGVNYESHGDHGHWYYDDKPKVVAKVLDANQGNPAHIYVYDDAFYIANDRKNGFTRISLKDIESSKDENAIVSSATFTEAGAGHITLAASGNIVAGTWLDREGDNAGRVDIAILSPDAKRGSSSSAKSGGKTVRQVTLSSGGLHGATAAGGKFFFAPSDGVCWINVDASLLNADAEVTVNHISLGSEDDKPLRTGAFTTLGNNVLLISGTGDSTFLGMLNASASNPVLQKISVPVEKGSRAFGPILLQPKKQSPVALIFHDSVEANQSPGTATIIQLNPNKDGSFSDAATMKQITVGPSQVSGHSGYHDAAGDEGGKYAWISNPGDATLQVLALDTFEIVATHKLPGSPGRLVSIGGTGRGQLFGGK